MPRYKLQNHRVNMSPLKSYNVVNRMNNSVSSVIACGRLEAIAKGRKLFASSFVELIH